MFYLLLSLLVLWTATSFANDKLKVAFQWKILDFDYPSEQDRQIALNGEFIPEYNIPVGLEVYGDRLFITVPRWKPGVAASLNYIRLTDPMDSPKLHPYPSWESHKILGEQRPEIISPFRVRADSCGRLWVMDTGIMNLLDEKPKYFKPSILIYDLENDKLIRSYTIPDDQIQKEDSLFANIVIEENDCDDSFAYLADVGRAALVVYSFKEDRSWVVQHHYFQLSPLAGEITVAGITYVSTDGVFGLALSKPDIEGYSSLYFHPMTSFNEFNVSTKVLRNESLAQNSVENFHFFRLLGSRGPKAQSGVSFLHKKTNVLFYVLINLNAVTCWRTTNPNYSMESQGRVSMSNKTMVFPSDIKIDSRDTLWVLSNKLPVFLHSSLNYEEYNFRILNSTVANAIKDTACDSSMKVNPDIVKNIQRNVTRLTSGSASYKIYFQTALVSLIAIKLI